MIARHSGSTGPHDPDESIEPLYASRYRCGRCRTAFPDEELPAGAAARLVRDGLNLVGNPALNLASAVRTEILRAFDESEMEGMLAKIG